MFSILMKVKLEVNLNADWFEVHGVFICNRTEFIFHASFYICKMFDVVLRTGFSLKPFLLETEGYGQGS